jgi:hypothetical protein
MVWEQNVHIIIMVTSLEERGKVRNLHLNTICLFTHFFKLFILSSQNAIGTGQMTQKTRSLSKVFPFPS